jgi:2-keto-4-pentenoate hydratase
VTDLDARLASALEVQLEHWRETLRSGAERVGWKLGLGERERIGAGPVIGHLTSATQLEPGGVYRADGAGLLHADVEVGIELGPQEAVVGYCAALELVDLASPDDPQEIVAANVFHRAFAFGPFRRSWPTDGVEAQLVVNGRTRAREPAEPDVAGLVHDTARLLGATGERLRAGDRMILGSIIQLPVETGDEVVADLGPLGRVQAEIAPGSRSTASVSSG